MSKIEKVSVGMFNKKMMDILNTYYEEVDLDVRNITKKLAPKAKASVKARSNVDTGVYKKGWSIKTYSSKGVYYVKIHNKNKYPITHLLEFGHEGPIHAKPYPHVTTTELEFIEKFREELKKEVK